MLPKLFAEFHVTFVYEDYIEREEKKKHICNNNTITNNNI